MEIGQRFYPPPTINLPKLTLAEPLPSTQYTFEAERRARRQFEDSAELDAKPERPVANAVNGNASSESLSSSAASHNNDVLLPCAAPPARIPPTTSHAATPKPVSFEEFEGRGTVFDELEWRTIDDKLALSEVLANVSMEALPKERNDGNPAAAIEDQKQLQLPIKGGTAVAIPSIRPYPVLDFGTGSKALEPTVVLNTTTEMHTAVYSKPPQPDLVKTPITVAHESPLRTRLLTKGYRENLVTVALERIPRERLPYVEYYIKGMSILEKRGVDPKKTVIFLLDSNISDKQAIVQRAQTAEQLIGMGFNSDHVFSALLTSDGDRVKALDTLLGSR